MRLGRLFGFAAALGLLAAYAQGVCAQQPYVGSNQAAMMQRLEAAETRIYELESMLDERHSPYRPASLSYDSVVRRLDALETAVASSNAVQAQDWVSTHNQRWTSKWGGRVHFQYFNFLDQNAASQAYMGDLQDYAEFRRLRFETTGTGYGVFDYKLQLEFEGNTVGIRDVWIGHADVPMFGMVRMGNFKEPIGLEELTSSTNISFIERSLPTGVFARSRQTGMAAYNSNQDESISWAYGVFFNSIDQGNNHEYIEDNQGIDLVGRIAWNPYYAYDGRCLMHVGLSGLYVDDADDSIRFRSNAEVRRTGVANSYIDTGAIAANDYGVFGLELANVWGPLSTQAEFYYCRVDDAGEDFYGAYAMVSYFLTGENRGYRTGEKIFDRVTPLENFWIVSTDQGRSIGTGAWELLLRWSYLDLSGTANNQSGTMNDITLGVNWYWNPYAKMMFNYIHSWNAYSNRADIAESDILGIAWRFDF